MRINYPQGANGMYYLSYNDIEQIATLRLKECFPRNLEHPMPLDTREYLEGFLGLMVKYVYIGLPEQKILGLTIMGDAEEVIECNTRYEPEVVEETYGTVLISTDLLGARNLPRRRYTLTHEAGHKELHGPYYDRLSRFRHGDTQQGTSMACRKIEHYRSPARTDYDWLEWQADTFAAAMLMPREVFGDYVLSLLRRSGVSCGYLCKGGRRDESIYREIIGPVAHAFQVSQRAAQIRMLHMGLIRTPARAF